MAKSKLPACRQCGNLNSENSGALPEFYCLAEKGLDLCVMVGDLRKPKYLHRVSPRLESVSLKNGGMPKTVIDCGNCGPDYSAIKRMIESNFDAVVEQTHGAEDTLERLQGGAIDLVCVNRKLDRDYSDGLDVIRQLLADGAGAEVPIMLVTNYEEHQQLAMEIGAQRGFGKLALADARTLALLEPFLGQRQGTASARS